MLKTVEEAKAIICPENIFLKDEANYVCYCVANGCMAWRWAESSMSERCAEFKRERRGYCGLAGPVKFD